MFPPYACLSTSELCSALSQFPDRNPSCLTPFTWLIPAASSGLNKPESAASCARRRTAASCWLMVFAARPRVLPESHVQTHAMEEIAVAGIGVQKIEMRIDI
jgi:hypothetical protein